jgi:hypothetical protein
MPYLISHECNNQSTQVEQYSLLDLEPCGNMERCTPSSRLAAKTGKFTLNGKEYPFEMNVRRSVIVNLVGGLDNNNCEVGLFDADPRSRILKRKNLDPGSGMGEKFGSGIRDG